MMMMMLLLLDLVLMNLALQGSWILTHRPPVKIRDIVDDLNSKLDYLSIQKQRLNKEEDSVSGIKAGVAAGMPVVALTTQNPEHLLMDAGATLLIKDFNDPKLWKALEELEKAATATA